MSGVAVTNADLAILLLIAEKPYVNGYGLRRLVEERGYVHWAGVSATSIYNRLKSLEERELIAGAADVDKADRGPQGRIYTVTAAGNAVLADEIKEGLAKTREHDPRFNLALCGLELLPPQTAVGCLSDRARFLDNEAARLAEMLAESRDDLPLSAILLYERIVHAIAAESAWLDLAITAVQDRS